MRKANNIYTVSKREWLINIIAILAILLGIAEIFYGSIWGMIVFLPFLYPIIKYRKHAIVQKKKEIMESQFKDMLISVADAMKSGYSVENSFRESYKEMRTMYGDDSMIALELKKVINRFKLNSNVEKEIIELAKRTDLEVANTFAQVFQAANRNGGRIAEIMENTVNTIRLKQEVKEEVKVMISGKVFEQKIMTCIPMALVIYISITSPGFLNVMYQTIMGKIIMTIFLIAYAIAIIWANRITKVEV